MRTLVRVLGLSLVVGCSGGGGGPAAPAVVVGELTGTLTEAGGTATFTVSLTTAPVSGSVSMPLSSSDPGEATVTPSSVSFDAENFDVPQTITVTGVDDFVDDGDVVFSIIVPAIPGYVDPADLEVTNVDDDTVGVSVTATDATSSEWGGRAIVEVVLDSQPVANVVFATLVVDTSEGTVVVGTSLTFTQTNWDTPHIVQVRGVADGVTDGDQTFSLTLGLGQSADPLYQGFPVAPVTLTNLEAPVVNVGYYDMSLGGGAANQLPPINAVGQTAIALTDLTAADLATIEVLFVQNPENSVFGAEYMSRLTDIDAAVTAGMILVIHDRCVTNAQTILPGGGAIVMTRQTGADIQVRDATTLITDGPAGTVGDTTLDNGTSSVHGYASEATLPAASVSILGTGTVGQSVTFVYPHGAGYVVYSSIPLDYYLAGATPAAFSTVYAPNVIAFGADTRQ